MAFEIARQLDRSIQVAERGEDVIVTFRGRSADYPDE
jgi:hypothetical protein